MTCKTCKGSTFTANLGDCPDCQLGDKYTIESSDPDEDGKIGTLVSNKPLDFISIQLSKEDAALLLHFSRNIGGSPAGPRGLFDRINEELSLVNVKPNRKQWHIDSFGHGIDVRWAT